MLRGVQWMGGRLAVNVLASGAENASAVVDRAGQAVLVGVITKGLTVDTAVSIVHDMQKRQIPVSVGLGAGDPHQWQAALEVSLTTQPAHLNQVFPTAAYALGRLDQVHGAGATVVNALISPTGKPGRVRLNTGPYSQAAPEAEVSVETAAALLRDAGIPSVKFFPVNGALDELAAMASAAVAFGIPLMEPTGGIDSSNLAAVTRTCLEAGCRYVVPHVYSAVVDRATGLTVPDRVVELVRILESLVYA